MFFFAYFMLILLSGEKCDNEVAEENIKVKALLFQTTDSINGLKIE